MKHSSEELQGYFNKTPWEIAFTGSADHGISLETLESIFGKWRSHAAKITGLRLSAMGILNKQGHPHVHCVLVGRNKKGRTLLDVDDDTIESLKKMWTTMARNSACIESVKDAGWVRYLITQNLLYNPKAEVLKPFGVNLIKELSA
jgi:hypothetical protein